MLYNPNQITRVVTPAASYNLVDIATVKTLLGITTTAEDAYLTLLISQVSALAANFCNRVFPVETVEDTFWPQRRGYWQEPRRLAPPLILTRYPVVTVNSVTEGVGGVQPSVLTADVDYKLNAINGELLRLDFLGYPLPWNADAIVVNYSGGYATIPPDLVMAIVSWIKAIRASQTRDPNLKSETVPGVYSASYSTGGTGDAPFGMPPEVAGALAAYNVALVG